MATSLHTVSFSKMGIHSWAKKLVRRFSVLCSRSSAKNRSSLARACPTARPTCCKRGQAPTGDAALDHDTRKRHHLFLKVRERAKALLNSNVTKLVDLRLRSPRKERSEPEGGRKADERVAKWHEKLFRLLCLRPAQQFLELLQGLGKDCFVLAIDECSALNSSRVPTSDHRAQYGMSLIAMQRIIKAADEFKLAIPFWLLLLDTNSSVLELVPPTKLSSSHRLVHHNSPTVTHVAVPRL